MFERIITNEEADFNLLKLANGKGKFGLQLAPGVGRDEEAAFQRGIDNEWFRLVDVSYIANSTGVFRVFKLTQAGIDRLAQLRSIMGQECEG